MMEKNICMGKGSTPRITVQVRPRPVAVPEIQRMRLQAQCQLIKHATTISLPLRSISLAYQSHVQYRPDFNHAESLGRCDDQASIRGVSMGIGSKAKAHNLWRRSLRLLPTAN